MTPFEFLLLSAAAYRVTRFFVFDSLMGANVESGTKWSVRLDKVAFDEFGQDRGLLRGKLGTLLTCYWCLGTWLSLALCCTYLAVWPWQLGRFGWLAVAAVAAGQSMGHVIERRLQR